jgi:hypothetical protein
MTNPEPGDVRTILDCDGAIVDADANRPHPTDLLEVERWMPWIGLEQFVVLIREPLNLSRELIVEPPEL